jgi:hypothetical protein
LLIFIHIEHTFCICPFLVAFFSATIDGRNLIFGHKLHIGTPYGGKCFWTHQIPTSCLPTLLIFIHIEHICSFFVAFFSATIDGILIYPCPSGYRYMLCPAISSYSFRATALIFCRMFIRIMEVCLSTGF